MATKLISQREARKLKKRVAELERERSLMFNRYRREFPGGVFARQFTCNEASQAALDMATKLDCALVGKMQGNVLNIYAVQERS